MNMALSLRNRAERHLSYALHPVSPLSINAKLGPCSCACIPVGRADMQWQYCPSNPLECHPSKES